MEKYSVPFFVKSMSKIKFAIIGLGHIGKRHADIILSNADAELIAFIEIKPSNEIKEYNLPIFDSLSDFIASDIEVDVMCIATPNYLHCQQAIKCLENNMHVVIEKPMGLTTEECYSVIEKSKEVNKNVFCVMQNRYSPPSIWLKEIVSSNVLGSIYNVQINCIWNRDENYYNLNGWKGKLNLDGGTLFTQFSHFVDTLYWIFGDIHNIAANFYNFNHKNTIEFEDSGSISFSLLNGGVGSINYSTSAYNKNIESSITILAEFGSIKIGGQYMEKVLHCEIKDYEMPTINPTNPPNDYGKYKGSAANHEYVIKNVINTINKKERIKTTALEGMKVVQMIEQIYLLRNINNL